MTFPCVMKVMTHDSWRLIKHNVGVSRGPQDAIFTFSDEIYNFSDEFTISIQKTCMCRRQLQIPGCRQPAGGKEVDRIFPNVHMQAPRKDDDMQAPWRDDDMQAPVVVIVIIIVM